MIPATTTPAGRAHDRPAMIGNPITTMTTPTSSTTQPHTASRSVTGKAGLVLRFCSTI